MLPGRRPAVVGEERARRVGDLEQARLGHLEDADLVGRPEPVLRRAEQPQRRVPLALEVDDRVDEVLERLGPGDRAVLRHVADQHDRDPVALREVHQPQRRLADLADAPAAPVELVDGRGLDRVDDDARTGRSGAGGLHDPPDLVLREDADALGRRARRAGRDAPPAGGPGPATPRPRRTAPSRRPVPASVRPRPGAAASTCRCPVRRRRGRATRARARRRGRDRTRRCRGAGAAGPRRRWPRDRSARRRRCAPPARRARRRARLADDRLDEAVPLRRPGTGLPSAGTIPRRSGRRSGSLAAPSLGRRRAARLTAPRPACAARRGGCRDRPRGPCPR